MANSRTILLECPECGHRNRGRPRDEDREADCPECQARVRMHRAEMSRVAPGRGGGAAPWFLLGIALAAGVAVTLLWQREKAAHAESKAAYERSVEESRDEVADLEERLRRAENEREQLDAENRDRREQIRHMDGVLQAQERALADLRESRTALRAANAELTRALEALRKAGGAPPDDGER